MRIENRIETMEPMVLMSAVIGSDNADMLVADGDDFVASGDGDDEIRLLAGSNFVDAGNGFDVVQFEGQFRDAFDLRPLGFGPIRLFSEDAINTLIDVERIVFADVEIDVQDDGTFVERDLTPSVPQPEEPVVEVPEVNRSLFGTGQWIAAQQGGITITGTDGDDQIYAPFDDVQIDGGTGTDTFVVYEGVRDEFQVTQIDETRYSIVGKGLNEPEVTIEFTSVEFIAFNDGLISLSEAVGESQVEPPSNDTDDTVDDRPVDDAEPDTEPPVQEDDRVFSVGDGIEAFHRSGQTFLTWDEDDSVEGERYHVYRHTSQITADNLQDAEQLTQRWGPLDDQTSVHQLATSTAPTHFVIQDEANPLSDETGLFVFTADTDRDAFYAVTTVVDGIETRVQSLETAVNEVVAAAEPILVQQGPAGFGLTYTQFQNYADWNPTFQGYAYNYTVGLPEQYDPDTAYGVRVILHGYGFDQGALDPELTDFRPDEIIIYADDPGQDRGTRHTWWYGFAADHNYQTSDAAPDSGTIRNFTEERILRAVSEVQANFNTDTSRIIAQGHSMGGTGALALGIRHGDVFGSVFASEPITDFAAIESDGFEQDYRVLWGTPEDNLRTENRDVSVSESTPSSVGVWDLLNLGDQAAERRGEQIAFLMVGHGKADNVVPFETQSVPFIEKLLDANLPFAAELRADATHSWLGFGYVAPSFDQQPFVSQGEWLATSDISYLGFNSSAGDPVADVNAPTQEFFLDVEWANAEGDFAEPIVDQADRYEVSIRSLDGSQSLSVTPHNVQNFRPPVGTTVVWNAVDQAGNLVQSGSTVVDQDRLFTIPDLQLSPNAVRVTVQAVNG